MTFLLSLQHFQSLLYHASYYKERELMHLQLTLVNRNLKSPEHIFEFKKKERDKLP